MFRKRYNRGMVALVLSIVFLPFLSSAQKVGAPRNSQNLIDAQRDFAQRFSHGKKGQRIINEGCLLGANPDLSEKELNKLTGALKSGQLSEEQKRIKSKGDALCQAQGENKVFGINEKMMQTVSYMWTLVMGIGGGDMSMRNLKQEASDAKKTLETAKEQGVTNVEKLEADADKAQERYNKHGENKRSDLCRYIPMGVENLAKFQQQTTNAHIVNHTGLHNNLQYAQMMRVARHYDSRSGNAKLLSAGWGVAASCYATMMAMGGGVMEFNPTKGWKNYLKLGASSFMALYYAKMISINGNRARHMRKVARSLPKIGDCNPITDRNCYCTEPSSKAYSEYFQYCDNFGLGRKKTPGRQKVKVRRACINADTTVDPQCRCVAQDNCLDDGFDVLFENTTSPGETGPTFVGSLRELSKGRFNENLPAAAEIGKKHAARTLDVFQGRVKNIPKDRPLSVEEQRNAENLQTFGLPKFTSRALALYRPSNAEKNTARKFLSSVTEKYRVPTKKLENHNRTIKKGPMPKSSNRKKRRESFSNPFSNLLKKKSSPDHSGKILSYAEKSQNTASVHSRKDISLFAIISRRYKISALNRIL